MEVLAKMELAGISLDEKWLAQESVDLENDLRSWKTIFELSGEEFNMNSPRQLGEILFEKCSLIRKLRRQNRTVCYFRRRPSKAGFKA